MPFVPIEVPPGVVKSESDYAASGRWIDMDHVRFVRGKPQKIGGVQKFIETSFLGTARAAKAWASYTGVQCLVWGTACRLYIFREGSVSTITPYRIGAAGITLGNNPFATTNGSPIVTVTDSSHGIEAAGTTVTFSGASAVGGITINGDYTVTEIVDVNTFTITHGSNASSTASGGGAAVVASYELNCGDVDPTYLLGWGVGQWGVGYWGTDASLASALISEPTNWSMDVYGEDLIVNLSNDGIWHYDTSGGLVRPTVITNAPTQVRYTFVTPERYIFALGCTTLTGGFDSMTVRWPDVEDFTDWTPSDTNTSNQRKLQGGTRLMAGTALAEGISVVWSDSSLFLFQFTGSGFVYDSRQVATNCGLIGPHAWTKTSGTAFWMSANSFWMYSGAAQPIPNVEDIKSFVFGDINSEHLIKSFAFYNSVFNEVWFVYPSNSSTEPDLYVMVDLDDFSWSHGTWSRTAAALYTVSEYRPILFGTNGYVYVHDVKDNPDNDLAALPFHIELAPTDIDGGNRSVDIFGFVPDFQTQGGDLDLYIYGKDHPRDDVMMSETLTIAPTDKLVDARVAGRQFGMKLSGDTVGSDFRMGRWGLEISGAGRKR